MILNRLHEQFRQGWERATTAANRSVCIRLVRFAYPAADVSPDRRNLSGLTSSILAARLESGRPSKWSSYFVC